MNQKHVSVLAITYLQMTHFEFLRCSSSCPPLLQPWCDWTLTANQQLGGWSVVTVGFLDLPLSAPISGQYPFFTVRLGKVGRGPSAVALMGYGWDRLGQLPQKPARRDAVALPLAENSFLLFI